MSIAHTPTRILREVMGIAAGFIEWYQGSCQGVDGDVFGVCRASLEHLDGTAKNSRADLVCAEALSSEVFPLARRVFSCVVSGNLTVPAPRVGRERNVFV